MPKALIAGCGYVGCALGIDLAAHGWEVSGLRRDVSSLPAEILPVTADLSRPETLRFGTDAFDAVFYTTGAVGFSEEAYRAAYVYGAGNLLAALDRCGVRTGRLLYVSSTGVYHQNGGEWVDEESVTLPFRFSGKVLLEGESLVLNSGIPAIVVRFGGIYGPGRTRLLDAVLSGTVPLSNGGPPTILNLVHQKDCAGMLRHLAVLENPKTLYCGVDNEPVEKEALLQWLADAAGVSLSRTAPDARMEPQRGGFRRVSNRLLVESGYRLAFPTYREGYGALLATRP